MRALVLGGTGHIGSHVVRALVAERYRVRVLCRSRERATRALHGVPVDVVEGTTEDGERLARAMDGCDWLFHCAGYYPPFTADVGPSVAAGIADVRRVMASARRAGVSRIVFTSSSSTIRRMPERLASEEDWEPERSGARCGFLEEPQPKPLDRHRPLYPTVKIAMEQEALRVVREGLPVVVVNPTFCIGEYDTKPFSGRLVLIVARGLPAYVEHRLNAVYTGDVGIGHVRAAERGRVGERYLLAGWNLRFSELASVIAREAGVPPPRWRVPYPVVAAAATVNGWWWRLRGGHGEPQLPARAIEQVREGQWLDGGKAVRELGLPQTPIEEAVRRAVAWFRQQGMLACGGD